MVRQISRFSLRESVHLQADKEGGFVAGRIAASRRNHSCLGHPGRIGVHWRSAALGTDLGSANFKTFARFAHGFRAGVHAIAVNETGPVFDRSRS